MKKILIGLTLLVSLPSFANTVMYSNDDGCLVEMRQRRNAVVLYVTKGGEQEFVLYGNDFSYGKFAYCADDNTEIKVSDESQTTDIKVSCSAHQNGHATTRGRVDIKLVGGELSEIKTDGQVKGFFGWKKESRIECLNLVRE